MYYVPGTSGKLPWLPHQPGAQTLALISITAPLMVWGGGEMCNLEKQTMVLFLKYFKNLGRSSCSPGPCYWPLVLPPFSSAASQLPLLCPRVLTLTLDAYETIF